MMQLELRSPAKKWAVLVALFSVTAAYVVLSAAQFLVSSFADIPDPVWLKRAVWLDPGDAEHRYRLGRYELLASQSPQDALPWLQSAAKLNPHAGRYWIDLALAQQSIGDLDSEKRSLENALAVNARTLVGCGELVSRAGRHRRRHEAISRRPAERSGTHLAGNSHLLENSPRYRLPAR